MAVLQLQPKREFLRGLRSRIMCSQDREVQALRRGVPTLAEVNVNQVHQMVLEPVLDQNHLAVLAVMRLLVLYPRSVLAFPRETELRDPYPSQT